MRRLVLLPLLALLLASSFTAAQGLAGWWYDEGARHLGPHCGCHAARGVCSEPCVGCCGPDGYASCFSGGTPNRPCGMARRP